MPPTSPGCALPPTGLGVPFAILRVGLIPQSEVRLPNFQWPHPPAALNCATRNSYTKSSCLTSNHRPHCYPLGATSEYLDRGGRT